MTRLYEADAYDTTTWPDSHWRATAPEAPVCPPLSGVQTADVAIIGAGYAGLNAALELVERFGMDVAVVEAAQPGWGASGRKGGFACPGGSKLSDAQLQRRYGAEAAREFRHYQDAAIDCVAENLDRYGIDADRGPRGEVMLAHRPRAWALLRRRAEGQPGARLIPRDALAEAGLDGPGFYGALIEPEGFPLHPLKYVQGLAAAALDAGVRLFGDTQVQRLTRDGDGWRLHGAQGTLRARRVLVATNGYSSDDLPDWIGGRTLPALSSILVTRKLSETETARQGWTTQRMAFDSRRLLHYFRLLPCGRFLFGTRGGLSARPDRMAATQRMARAHFDTLFPAWRDVETERSWSGLVCLTGSLTPFAGAVPDRPGLYAAFGWHGNGVSAASLAGRRIAHAMAGRPNPAPALMQRPPRRFPLPALRRSWLRLAYIAYGIADGPVRGG